MSTATAVAVDDASSKLWAEPPRAELPQRKTAAGVVLTRVGIAFAFGIAGLYLWAGSPWSAAAFTFVGVAILVIHVAVPQNVPLIVVSNVVTTVVWITIGIVGLRTGGPQSPMVMWCLFPPITQYVISGRRCATIWAALSAAEIAMFHLVNHYAGPLHNDLSPGAADLHGTVMLIACVASIGLVLTGNDSVRAVEIEHLDRAKQALERQRILGDMHDGIGSQLLGLMLQVRAKAIDDERLLQGLTSCLDDLKLIVDSLDPTERSFELATAELRARLEPRCSAAGVELDWTIDDDAPTIDAERTLQVLRALQEMTSNALRHASTERIEVTLRRAPDDAAAYEVRVRDHGVGFDPDAPARIGRGLTSLRARAQRLGGELHVQRAEPGTLVALRFPL